MKSLFKLTRWAFRVIAVFTACTISAASALDQQALNDSSSAMPSTDSKPCESCFGVSGAMKTAEDCEDGLCPRFGLHAEAWPPPGALTPCDPCDEFKTCPKPNDYFLFPPRPRWYAVIDGAAICRNPSRSVAFASMANDTLIGAPPIVLSTSQFDYDFAATGRFLLGLTLDDDFQMEGSYFMLADAENSSALADPDGQIFSPFSLDPETGLNFANIHCLSSLHGAEINLRRTLPAIKRLTLSTLLGVRYLGLPEQFDYYGRPDDGSPATSIHARTTNEMVGPQIGARAELNTDDRWWINCEIKAAVLNNHATQTISGSYASSAEGNHTAFAGDLALKVVYRWSPHVATHIGYQALWLEGLALAPDNIGANIDFMRQTPPAPDQLKSNSGSFYHGPFAGLEIGW